jgi:hypothetical protein
LGKRALMPSLRFHVQIRDVPAAVAARKLGLTLEAFTAKLPELLKRRFPPADPTTGNFDLKAIDAWQDARHPHLSSGETAPSVVSTSSGLAPIRERLRNLVKPSVEQPQSSDPLAESYERLRRGELSYDQLPPGKYPNGLRVYADGEWEAIVRSKPLGKRERNALGGYFRAKGQAVHVTGAGGDTIERLQARGFIVGPPEGVSDHTITPAGEAEWLRISKG